MSAYILGKNCKAYYGVALTSASYVTPILTAVEATNIQDLTLNLTNETADISTRGTGGWKASATTTKDASITFSMLWSPADAFFTAVQGAFIAETEIAFYALDGIKTAASGSQGLVGNFQCKSFSRKEGLKDAVTVDVELVPSSYNGWFTA